MFVVIENTPGYMPDDDDPPTFDRLDDARIYASDRLSSLLDAIYDGQADVADPAGFDVQGTFQDDTWVIVYDHSREHDLGRVIEIMEIEDES